MGDYEGAVRPGEMVHRPGPYNVLDALGGIAYKGANTLDTVKVGGPAGQLKDWVANACGGFAAYVASPESPYDYFEEGAGR